MIRLLLIALLLATLAMLLRGFLRMSAAQRKAIIGKLLFWLGFGVLLGLVLIGKLHPLALAAALAVPLIKWLALKRLVFKRSPRRHHRPAPRHREEMSEAEAWAILDLAPNPSIEQIKAAHRNKMRIHHPDRGGTLEHAQRINQAKDRLLANPQHPTPFD